MKPESLAEVCRHVMAADQNLIRAQRACMDDLEFDVSVAGALIIAMAANQHLMSKLKAPVDIATDKLESMLREKRGGMPS